MIDDDGDAVRVEDVLGDGALKGVRRRIFQIYAACACVLVVFKDDVVEPAANGLSTRERRVDGVDGGVLPVGDVNPVVDDLDAVDVKARAVIGDGGEFVVARLRSKELTTPADAEVGGAQTCHVAGGPDRTCRGAEIDGVEGGKSVGARAEDGCREGPIVEVVPHEPLSDKVGDVNSDGSGCRIAEAVIGGLCGDGVNSGCRGPCEGVIRACGGFANFGGS